MMLLHLRIACLLPVSFLGEELKEHNRLGEWLLLSHFGLGNCVCITRETRSKPGIMLRRNSRGVSLTRECLQVEKLSSTTATDGSCIFPCALHGHLRLWSCIMQKGNPLTSSIRRRSSGSVGVQWSPRIAAPSSVVFTED